MKEPRCAAARPLHDAIEKLRNLDETDEWHQGFHAALDEALELVRDHDCAASIKVALQALKAQGKKTGGSTPYGYTTADDGVTLVELPDEQRVITLVRKRRAEEWTFRKIADELHKLKIRPRERETGSRRKRRRKPNGRFYANQLIRMLKTLAVK